MFSESLGDGRARVSSRRTEHFSAGDRARRARAGTGSHRPGPRAERPSAAAAGRWRACSPCCSPPLGLAHARHRPPRASRAAHGADRASSGGGGGLARRAHPARRLLAARAPRARGGRAAGPSWSARFSRLAMTSVIVLVASALPLAWTYTGSVAGLVGTGYGSLVRHQGHAARGGARARRRSTSPPPAARPSSHPRPALRARLPHLVEAEAIILVMIVFTASALSAQPPAIDLPARERATVAEVVEVFRPKVPSLARPRWTRCGGIGRRRRPAASAPRCLSLVQLQPQRAPVSSCSG